MKFYQNTVGEGFALPQANPLHTVKSTEGARAISTTKAVKNSLPREGGALPYIPAAKREPMLATVCHKAN